MRIVLIGVSHWHTPFYLNPLLSMPGMSVVGVSDPDLGSRWRDRARRHTARRSTTIARCARG